MAQLGKETGSTWTFPGGQECTERGEFYLYGVGDEQLFDEFRAIRYINPNTGWEVRTRCFGMIEMK